VHQAEAKRLIFFFLSLQRTSIFASHKPYVGTTKLWQNTTLSWHMHQQGKNMLSKKTWQNNFGNLLFLKMQNYA
jgi:hypothetical protein